MGLEWTDINFNIGYVSITKTLQKIHGELIEGTHKNNNSIRHVPISEPTIEILKEYKVFMENMKYMVGRKRKNTKKIFSTTEGEPIHPDTPRKIFGKI